MPASNGVSRPAFVSVLAEGNAKVVSVKICGITSPKDAEMCVAAGARALGFVFYGKDPRAISPARAGEICRMLPGHVRTVGVFVNARRDVIEEICDRAGLDMVQLAGDEPPEECRTLTRKVVKVFRPACEKDLAPIARYAECSAYLIDTPVRGHATGSAWPVEWAYARRAKQFRKPIILGGALNAANVAPALRKVDPAAIDVCAGVESEPGVKDPRRVRALFEALWRYDDEVRQGSVRKAAPVAFGGRQVAFVSEPPARSAAPTAGPEPAEAAESEEPPLMDIRPGGLAGGEEASL